MFIFVIALAALVLSVGAIYLILRNMGEDGIEVAAPGSCKSGRCGVRCTPAPSEAGDEAPEDSADPEQAEPRKLA